jgi:hypothetical protein
MMKTYYISQGRIRPERRREHRREDRLDSQHRLCATHFASTF